MMDIKVVACVVLIVVSIVSVADGEEHLVGLSRYRRSPSMDTMGIDRMVRGKRSPAVDGLGVDRVVRKKRSPAMDGLGIYRATRDKRSPLMDTDVLGREIRNKRSPSMDTMGIYRATRDKRSPSMDTFGIDRVVRNKRSPNSGNTNSFSSGTSSAVATASGDGNSFSGASASSRPGFGTQQNSWSGNSNSPNLPSTGTNAVQPPSTSWMIPPPQTPVYKEQPVPFGYTPVIGLSGTIDLNDPSPLYQEASANCDSFNCNINYNPPKQNSNTNSQNFPNYYPSKNINYHHQSLPQYSNQMPYNPSGYPKPNYANTNYGNSAGNGGYASAGSFANGGVGGYQPPVNNQRYPGFNEISVNSRFGPVQDGGWPSDDPFKWVHDQNRAIQAKIQAQIDHFRQLSNQQSFLGMDDGTAWAWGSSSAGPSGGSQAGAFGPAAPGIESRFAENIPSSGGSGTYSSFSSSSSSSTVDQNGQVHTTKEVMTGVNDNGKVTVKHIKDP